MAATATPSVMRTRSRILVASADPLFRDRVKRSPAYADVTSEEAVGGAHALAKLLQWPCDGVLLDRNLPDLDAQEVAEQIRKQYPQIAVELVDPGTMSAEAQAKNDDAEVLGEVAATANEEEATETGLKLPETSRIKRRRVRRMLSGTRSGTNAAKRRARLRPCRA
jgi:CheY-like chemotaxis protein